MEEKRRGRKLGYKCGPDTLERIKAATTGARNAKAVLDEGKVAYIKREKGQQTARELAEHYGVALATIYDIWAGRTWTHV